MGPNPIRQMSLGKKKINLDTETDTHREKNDVKRQREDGALQAKECLRKLGSLKQILPWCLQKADILALGFWNSGQ